MHVVPAAYSSVGPGPEGPRGQLREACLRYRDRDSEAHRADAPALQLSLQLEKTAGADARTILAFVSPNILY